MELAQVPDPSGLTFNTTAEERDFYKENYERLRRGYSESYNLAIFERDEAIRRHDEARAEVERLEDEVTDLKENLEYALRRVEAVAKLRASPTLT